MMYSSVAEDAIQDMIFISR